jgi:hypothetical protein
MTCLQVNVRHRVLLLDSVFIDCLCSCQMLIASVLSFSCLLPLSCLLSDLSGTVT